MKHLTTVCAALIALAGPIAQATTIEMNVKGLVCGFCAQGIEKKLRKLAATADVVVSLEEHLVAVALKDGQDIPEADLRKALTDAGYTVTAIQRTDTPIANLRSRATQGKP